MTDADRKSLTITDWADAALDTIADAGLKGVAVERLARQLRVTKGSFYWHFPNRDALLRAAVERWERQQTDDVIAQARQEQDGRARMARLFRNADGSKRAGQLYLAFAAAARDPVVGTVVRRVNNRRVRFMEDCYLAMGLEPGEARQRALLAYSVYLGFMQLKRDTPDLMPRGPEFQDYLAYINQVLVPRFVPEPAEDSHTHNAAGVSSSVGDIQR